MTYTKIILPILLCLIYTFGILLLPSQASKINFSFTGNSYLNSQFNFQLVLLGIACISMLSTYLLNPEGFKTMFATGNITATGKELKFFGIKEGDTWLKTGLSLVLVISLVTATFMYFQLQNHKVDYGLLKSGIIWILLFSLSNSFSEEMIFRLGLNVPLDNVLSSKYIFLLSAIIFGLAHFYGMPSGFIGIILAGVLGYVLSKSLHETQGVFWAWLIHFLQDVIIIGSIYLMKNGSTI